MSQTQVVTVEASVHRTAAVLAGPALKLLMLQAEKYPASYSRERIMERADEILDRALEVARGIRERSIQRAPEACIICDNAGGGYCEFCKP